MNAPFDIEKHTLETERMILRPFRMEDLDDLYEYASVPGVGEEAGWPHHKNKEESLYRVRHFIEGRHTFAIVYKENHKVIGSIGIDPMDEDFVKKISEFHSLYGREIGYVLSKDYWGRGLMTEAVKAVIDYLFDELDFDFLLCGHYDKNKRSKRVQEKLGFLPYRRLMCDTQLGVQEPGMLNLLLNPHKSIELTFSHPETLVFVPTPVGK